MRRRSALVLSVALPCSIAAAVAFGGAGASAAGTSPNTESGTTTSTAETPTAGTSPKPDPVRTAPTPDPLLDAIRSVQAQLSGRDDKLYAVGYDRENANGILIYRASLTPGQDAVPVTVPRGIGVRYTSARFTMVQVQDINSCLKENFDTLQNRGVMLSHFGPSGGGTGPYTINYDPGSKPPPDEFLQSVPYYSPDNFIVAPLGVGGLDRLADVSPFLGW